MPLVVPSFGQKSEDQGSAHIWYTDSEHVALAPVDRLALISLNDILDQVAPSRLIGQGYIIRVAIQGEIVSLVPPQLPIEVEVTFRLEDYWLNCCYRGLH
jgi:hypothetical protein